MVGTIQNKTIKKELSIKNENLFRSKILFSLSTFRLTRLSFSRLNISKTKIPQPNGRSLWSESVENNKSIFYMYFHVNCYAFSYNVTFCTFSNEKIARLPKNNSVGKF